MSVYIYIILMYKYTIYIHTPWVDLGSWQIDSQIVALLKSNTFWCPFFLQKHPAAAAEAELVLAE